MTRLKSSETMPTVETAIPDYTEFGIAPELARFVTPEKLAENRKNFEEFDVELNAEDRRQLEIIGEVLLEIPLTHGSYNNLDSVVPHVDRPKESFSHTGSLDVSVGLHRYAFFHWGVPDWWAYGPKIHLFNANLLLDPQTIVSSYDIGLGGISDAGAYDDLEEAEQQYINRYFDHLLSGIDWLELQARSVLLDYKKAKKKHLNAGGTMEDFRYRFVIYSPIDFGEIKHLGTVKKSDYPVDSNYFPSETSKSEWFNHYKQLYERGLAYENIEQDIKSAKRGRPIVNPIPEQFNVDYDEVGKFWPRMLEKRKNRQ